MALMLSATTPVPSAVSATFVAARPPALHARVPLLGRIRQAASAALVVFCLLRPSTDLSTATGNPKDSPTDTILTPRLFRRTISALTKSFLTRTSISSVTPKPALPSCPLLDSSSLSLPPTPMSRHNFFASMSCCWERTAIFLRRALYLEGCCFVYVFLCVCVWRARSTSFRLFLRS